jgi:MFS transporter, DHA2 family, multidrug resistance protein
VNGSADTLVRADRASTASAAASTPFSPARQRIAIMAVSCAVALSTVSLGAVGVALPVIARELTLPPAATVWLISGFQLVLLATLLPFAALGERWGYRRVFLSGLFVIALTSFVCARSGSFGVLLAARLLQGLGASAVMAVNPALLRLSVPPDRLGKAIGLNAMTVAVFTALGPSLAAFVIARADWTWIFLLNIPWAAIAVVIGRFALPANPATPARGFDVAGALLNVCTFVLLASGLDRLTVHGYEALPQLALGAACGWAFVVHQRHKAAPLLPLDLLRNRVVRRCVGASVFAFAAQMAAMVALPFLLDHTYRRDVMSIGFIMMAWPLAVALMAPAAGWLEGRRIASWRLCVAGGGIMGVALLCIAALPADAGNGVLVVAMVLSGVGFGAFQTPNNRAMLGATPRERSGGAGGLQATARLTGQMLGASTVGTAYRLVPEGTIGAAGWALVAAAAFALLSAAFSLRRRG